MQLQTLTEKMVDLYGIDNSASNFTSILNQCVKKISEEYPKILRSFVNSIAEQERYVVEQEGLIRIVKVFYDRHNMSNSSPVDSLFLHTPRYSISSQLTTICEHDIIDKLNPVDAEIVDFNVFELIPAPIESNLKIYYEYHAYRTLSEIPDIFEEVFIKLFLFYDSEMQFRSAMRSNNGNVFTFDRRGNINADDGGGENSEVITREKELKFLIKEIRTLVMKMRR